VVGALRSVFATHRRLLWAAIGTIVVVTVAFAALPREGSSATPPSVKPAKPAVWHPTPAPTFPLQTSSNGRYLVDHSVRPFLMVGGSPQALMVNVSPAQADRFFADRERAGFDAMWINLLCDQYTGGRANATTYDGIAPFRRPGDLSTPNRAYFARAAGMVGL